MKIYSFLFAALVGPITAWAQSPDGSVYEAQTVGADTYTLTCDWLKKSVFDSYPGDFCRTDFFIYDGILYFNHAGADGEHYLYRVNASDGEYLGRVDIEWGEVPHGVNASTFVGQDDEGTPFISSFAQHGNTNYPYTITMLDIVDGMPVAVKTYELTNIAGWWLYETTVSGSLKSGNFRAVAAVKVYGDNRMPNPWGYAEWVFDGSSTFPATCAKMTVSKGIAKPVADGKVVVYDCDDNLINKADYDCKSPTLCRFHDDETFDVIDTFAESSLENTNATGLDFAEYDGKNFMLYGAGFAPTRYGVACLKDFPESLKADVLWTLAASESFSSYPDTKEELFRHEFKNMTVHADKQADDGLQFYVYTNQAGLAKYTIKKKSVIQTGVEEIGVENCATEFFTLSGLRLATMPTQPGCYIKRSQGSVEKIIIR